MTMNCFSIYLAFGTSSNSLVYQAKFKKSFCTKKMSLKNTNWTKKCFCILYNKHLILFVCLCKTELYRGFLSKQYDLRIKLNGH
jgi:hypothetical protein